MRIVPHDQLLLAGLNAGKLYELFVLAGLLCDMESRAFAMGFVGSSLAFNASPGKIKQSEPHFTLTSLLGSQFWIFVDIEFVSVGMKNKPVNDYSRYHELDIVAVDAISANQTHDEIALAVECKCHAKFAKKSIKEALGIAGNCRCLRQASGPA